MPDSPPRVKADRLCQIEIQVADLSKALAFYQGAFGWEKSPAEIHRYCVLEVPDACPFGISLIPSKSRAKAHSSVTLCFDFANNQDELDDWMATIDRLGGKVLGTRTLPGYGSMVRVSDPDGNSFGLLMRERR